MAAGPDGFMMQRGLYWVYTLSLIEYPACWTHWKLKSYNTIYNECNLPFLSWSSTGRHDESRNRPPLQYHRAPYQPTMGAPTPQETLAVQLRSANSKVSKATNERKAAAKRAAQQVGFVCVCATYVVYFCQKKKLNAI